MAGLTDIPGEEGTGFALADPVSTRDLVIRALTNARVGSVDQAVPAPVPAIAVTVARTRARASFKALCITDQAFTVVQIVGGRWARASRADTNNLAVGAIVSAFPSSKRNAAAVGALRC